MILYKYLTTEIGKIVLTNCSIRFTQPVALNDPFETHWLYEDAIKEETLRIIKEEFPLKFGRKMTDDEQLSLPTKVEEVISKLPYDYSEKIGFLSLSKENNISLMWSHYADEHQGLVIGFDSEIFPDADEVEYSEIRPTYTEPEDRDAGIKQFIKLLMTKSEHWRYEQEFRSIDFLENADSVAKEQPKGFNVYLFKFPPDCIKEVIFGCLTPQSERKEIAEMITKDFQSAKLSEAKLSNASFDLDILPYDK